MLNFFEEFNKDEVTELACGRKHYVLLNKHNQLMVWGNVFSEKIEKKNQSEGFSLHFGDALFDGGKIKQLSMKYGIFGALVEHK